MLQQVPGTLFGKEFHNALGHHAAKPVNGTDLFGGGLAQLFHGTKMLRQQGCGLVADVADAQRVYQPLKTCSL